MWQENRILVGDCLKGLRSMPDGCVQTCVTSPPYFRLRDYGAVGQIGLEDTPEEYVERLVEVFEEVRRVLRSDGTLWLNLGDSYWNSGKAVVGSKGKTGSSRTRNLRIKVGRRLFPCKHPTIKPKDLVGCPWMVAFALRARGWYLRQDIIYYKLNPMPESVRDRCTKAHEYLFLLAREPRYYFDVEAIKQPMKASSIARLSQDIEHQAGSDRIPGKTNGRMKAVGHVVGGKKHKNLEEGGKPNTFHQTRNANGRQWESLDGKVNKRSVWPVGSQPFSGNHFATFPEALIADCIKAGSRPGDLVLDPFMGTGTTAVVAAMLGRRYAGFELNPEYAAMADQRLKERLGMFHKGP